MGLENTRVLQRRGFDFAANPLVQVLGFVFIFLVTSLLGAVPFALVTGKNVVGIWYIFPFTLVFLHFYQRWAHRESIFDLGLDWEARWPGLVAAGFLATGLGVALFNALQLATGWMGIATVNITRMEPLYAAAGIGLALLLNLGIGIGEELIFRGYILRRLLLGYRSYVPGVVATAALYSFAHIQTDKDPLVLTNLFLLGIVCGLAVVLTRSLWLAIGIHMGWDFWSEGVYLYLMPGMTVSRVFTYEFHLSSWGEMFAFKMISSAVLIAAAAFLVRRIHLADASREGFS